ncbi:MAG: hypothetical protein O2809_04270 [Proteobacteria bacterium]|nr:hypothetical protein [Pseudomonadota bacterium]
MTQTAAIVDHELTLPINGSVQDVGKGSNPLLLPYVLESVLEQLLQTIN